MWSQVAVIKRCTLLLVTFNDRPAARAREWKKRGGGRLVINGRKSLLISTTNEREMGSSHTDCSNIISHTYSLVAVFASIASRSRNRGGTVSESRRMKGHKRLQNNSNTKRKTECLETATTSNRTRERNCRNIEQRETAIIIRVCVLVTTSKGWRTKQRRTKGPTTQEPLEQHSIHTMKVKEGRVYIAWNPTASIDQTNIVGFAYSGTIHPNS